VLRAPRATVAAVERFAWTWPHAARAWQVRLFDAEFAEVACLGPTAAGATSLPVPDAVRQILRPGATYHWVVESEGGGELRRSEVAAFTLAAR
jgi:hypothetical protein